MTNYIMLLKFEVTSSYSFSPILNRIKSEIDLNQDILQK